MDRAPSASSITGLNRPPLGQPPRDIQLLALAGLLTTGWVVYLYVVDLILQFSGLMLAASTLRMVVFGPGVALFLLLGVTGLWVRHRRLARGLLMMAMLGAVVSACAPAGSGGTSSICQSLNSYCLSGSPMR